MQTPKRVKVCKCPSLQVRVKQTRRLRNLIKEIPIMGSLEKLGKDELTVTEFVESFVKAIDRIK